MAWRSRFRTPASGIAPDFLPYVFDRFRQADSRTTRQHGGLGLGLAIARHLVEQHGGKMTAHSEGPGLGTSVLMRLPGGSARRSHGERHGPIQQPEALRGSAHLHGARGPRRGR